MNTSPVSSGQAIRFADAPPPADSAVLLHDLLDRAAAVWPDHPAVSCGAETVTHAELAARSQALADWLHSLGLRRGDRVVLVMSSCTVLPALCHAASRLGAIFTVLHDQSVGRPLDHVLGDCTPALVIAESPEARAIAETRGIVAVSAEAAGAAAEQPAHRPGRHHRAAPSDTVCLVYTSGSTSLPKAVVSTHAQILFAAAAIQHELAYGPDDIVYCPLPLSFDYGLYQLFLGSLSGARVHLGLAQEAGPLLARRLAATAATVLAAVPSVVESLARLIRRDLSEPLSLRLLTTTGAAMPPEPLAVLRGALPALRVQLMYGLTECKRVAIMPPDGDLERPGACGLALPGTEVFAVDTDGRRLPPGRTGEFVVCGPHVMSGYWGRPDLTAERFTRAPGTLPTLRTGDFGRVDADGFLYFSGRADDLYKERGFRVSGIEVESAARRVSGVDEAALLPPRDALPAVLLVTGALTPAEVLAGLREELEVFKIPAHCLTLEALPLTANGKVDRAALRAVAQDRLGSPRQGGAR
ncbi:class I adenylate-forming enzyme family protein [Streptomyces sp. NPDC001165]|uniref:class I adenylate-forming enzyme family protein n=1 Tax=Streptomyces sp. NPDC001165 TaxID=3364546 RepID=UPI0036A6C7D2